jgi:hypothetical protein
MWRALFIKECRGNADVCFCKNLLNGPPRNSSEHQRRDGDARVNDGSNLFARKSSF